LDGTLERGVGNRYAKQLVENRKFRQEWAEKVGLGFEIPKPVISEPELVAILAIQNQEGGVAA
jgi:hypothetical protein